MGPEPWFRTRKPSATFSNQRWSQSAGAGPWVDLKRGLRTKEDAKQGFLIKGGFRPSDWAQRCKLPQFGPGSGKTHGNKGKVANPSTCPGERRKQTCFQLVLRHSQMLTSTVRQSGIQSLKSQHPPGHHLSASSLLSPLSMRFPPDPMLLGFPYPAKKHKPEKSGCWIRLPEKSESQWILRLRSVKECTKHATCSGYKIDTQWARATSYLAATVNGSHK